MPEMLIINFAKGRSTTGGVSRAGSVSHTGCWIRKWENEKTRKLANVEGW